MPHLRVMGIPDGFTQQELQELRVALEKSLAAISALEIKEENVFVYFHEDCRRKVGSVVVCDAVLFETPKRTAEVRKEFADKVTETIQQFLPQSTVKCMAFPFDRAWGYSTREPKNTEMIRR